MNPFKLNIAKYNYSQRWDHLSQVIESQVWNLYRRKHHLTHKHTHKHIPTYTNTHTHTHHHTHTHRIGSYKLWEDSTTRTSSGCSTSSTPVETRCGCHDNPMPAVSCVYNSAQLCGLPVWISLTISACIYSVVIANDIPTNAHQHNVCVPSYHDNSVLPPTHSWFLWSLTIKGVPGFTLLVGK